MRKVKLLLSLRKVARLSWRSYPMQYLKQYLKQQKTHREARQWLVYSDADKLAAHCLFYLNRIARRTQNHIKKHFIYTCKNHLLRLFYELGYCVDLTQQRQALICWHTRDYNEGWEDHEIGKA